MAVTLRGARAILLPGTGSDDDYLRRAFGPALTQAGVVFTAHRPCPDRLVAGYLDALDETLARLSDFPQPDILFYNAGVDPHADDRLGRLALSDTGLAERDRRVIRHFLSKGIPVAGVLGGGYSSDIDTVARRHTILHRVASEFAG